MDHAITPAPRIAIVDSGGGAPLDLTPEQAVATVERFPDLRHEWRKWQAKTGGGGRLVIVHPEWVAKLKVEIVDR
jgi:hypothetical protein